MHVSSLIINADCNLKTKFLLFGMESLNFGIKNVFIEFISDDAMKIYFLKFNILPAWSERERDKIGMY